MARVTSKLQVTIPKAVAERYGIKPGSEIEWIPAGETIRVVPTRKRNRSVDEDRTAMRLKLFDDATERQRRRDVQWKGETIEPSTDRGWKREDLYTRGFPR